MNKKQIIYTAKKTLATEVKGIKSLAKTFNTNFHYAVNTIFNFNSEFFFVQITNYNF